MRKLLLPAGVNLLLGVPGVVPVFLVWYVLANGPLATLGWTERDPNENDGMWLWLVIVVPVVGLYGLVWGLVNARLRRRTPVSRTVFWTVCAVASLTPFFAIGLF
ncbi:hypothetical protein [Streptomyces litmocidini]|uniref:Integral membrane protein n=1 Tax=Streptomyces litmocidini TaxID=67318 RepID=A0ABW7U5J8_9ACTN